MKIKFLRDCTYHQNDPDNSREYKAGETYEVLDDHGERWIRRGFAVQVDKPKGKAAEAMVPSAPIHAPTPHKGHGKSEAV